MYPNLSYLFHDLFGTARDNALSIIQMFGLFFGIAFFTLGYVLYLELKRKEKEGLIHPVNKKEKVGAGASLSEMLSNGVFGFILGFKLPVIAQDFDAFKLDAAGVVFSGQGNLLVGLVVGALFAGYTYWQGLKSKLDKPKMVMTKIFPSQRIGDIIIIAAIFGIAGAKIFSVLENLDAFWQDPLGQLFSGSGLTVYGGLILAFIANYIYVQRNGIPPIHVMDAIAPALILGYAVGRIGCQISGDGDWGIVNELSKPSWFFLPDWAWAYDYPNNVLNEGITIDGCADRYCRKLSQSVYPTPIYEVIGGVLIFLVLWVLRKRVTWTGFIFFLFAILMSTERFLVEFIRVNPRYGFLGMELSQAQFISMGIFIGGIIGMVYWYRRRDRPVEL